LESYTKHFSQFSDGEAMHPDYRKGLLRLQSDLDQRIAEAESLVENANMPVPEWGRANEALRDLGTN
jgi:hypothetical protein